MDVRNLSHQLIGICAVVEIIVGQRCHMHHTLDRVWQLHIKTVFGHTRDHTGKDLSDVSGHVLHFFQLFCLAFCLICDTLRLTGMFCDLRQDLFVMRDPLCIHPAPQIIFDDTVDLQIRISADRRGKMTVIWGCQTKMPGADCGIFCLFHGAECQAADQCLLWCSINLCKQFLQFFRMDLVLPDLHRIAEIVDKCA